MRRKATCPRSAFVRTGAPELPVGRTLSSYRGTTPGREATPTQTDELSSTLTDYFEYIIRDRNFYATLLCRANLEISQLGAGRPSGRGWANTICASSRQPAAEPSHWRNRFITTPDGEPGLNYLCAGYKLFFNHIDPAMKTMASLLRQGRFADEIMQLSTQD